MVLTNHKVHPQHNNRNSHMVQVDLTYKNSRLIHVSPTYAVLRMPLISILTRCGLRMSIIMAGPCKASSRIFHCRKGWHISSNLP